MSAPRGLSDDEKSAWEAVAKTVKPLASVRRARRAQALPKPAEPSASKPPASIVRKPAVLADPAPSFETLLSRGVGQGVSPQSRTPKPLRPAPAPPAQTGLDSHWDRKLKSGQIAPDFTLDLHGHTLDQAYDRLESGLFQAKAMQARLVLLIAGKSRPVDAADRGSKRGAIRAKILDWLAAGPHGNDIAAIRKAHRRHGGEGALYLVLKRGR